MKKILILALLMAVCSQGFAFLRQGNWRWRRDDGSEITATWLAAANTAPTISSSTDVLRLRYEVLSTLTVSTDLEDTLQWATSTAGPWTNLDVTAGSSPFVIAGSSAFVTQGELTTPQLAQSLNYPWYPGKIMVDSQVLKWTLPQKYRTEYEWSIKPTPNVAANATYYFRSWGATSELQNGKTYPSLKTAGVLPICFASLQVNQEGKKVKVEWVTACERNNSHFDVERSGDGQQWSVVATVKGSVNTSTAQTYSAYDAAPLNGNNFYRIRQYDFDGKSATSVVRSLKMFVESTGMLQVYPNPVQDKINFSLAKGIAQQTVISLYTISGKLIHSETLAAVASNTSYTLRLGTKPAPGVYMLIVSATGISESIKVVVK